MTKFDKPTTNSAGCSPCTSEAHHRADVTPKFKVGDIVTYTNDYGVAWRGRTITGIEYWEGLDEPRYFYEPHDAHWYSVPESSLTLETAAVAGENIEPPAKIVGGLTAHIKALNGTRGRGAYYVRIRHVRDWNEVQVRLTDGQTTRATQHIDLGHTKESRDDAIREIYGTIKQFITY
jgi:hypothetical protein